MPTYDYKCNRCGERFEVFHGMKDVTPRMCPKCGSVAQQLIGSGGGILFRGNGFHTNDYPSRTHSAQTGTRCGREAPCCGRDSFCGNPKCET